MEEAWGQLVSLTDVESEPVLITSDRLTIGRAPGNVLGVDFLFILTIQN